MIIHKNSYLRGYDDGLDEAARCEGFGTLDNTDWNPLPNIAMWNKLKATIKSTFAEDEDGDLLYTDIYGTIWKLQVTAEPNMPLIISVVKRI